jgi:lysophospholipase L1-like esterase
MHSLVVLATLLALTALAAADGGARDAARAAATDAAPAPPPAPPDPPLIAFPGQYAPRAPEQKYSPSPKSCQRLEPAERLACLQAVAFDFPTMSRYAAANAALAPPRPGERRVVFMGDSITDNWSKTSFGGFFPGKPYVNRGIGAQTTGQMLIRFRADVIALKPRVVVILAGTNDVSGNAGPVAPEAIQDNLASMAELARVAGIKVVLASLLPVTDAKVDASGKPIQRTTDRPPETLRALNGWIARYARKHGHVFLDYFTAMIDERGALKAELTGDGLHPNAAGYTIMAPLAEKAIAAALRR